MRLLYLLSFSLPFSLAAAAPPPVPATGATAPPAGAARGEIAAREPSKTVRYALYKFMQRIGIERDTFTPVRYAEQMARQIQLGRLPAPPPSL